MLKLYPRELDRRNLPQCWSELLETKLVSSSVTYQRLGVLLHNHKSIIIIPWYCLEASPTQPARMMHGFHPGQEPEKHSQYNYESSCRRKVIPWSIWPSLPWRTILFVEFQGNLEFAFLSPNLIKNSHESHYPRYPKHRLL